MVDIFKEILVEIICFLLLLTRGCAENPHFSLLNFLTCSMLKQNTNYRLNPLLHSCDTCRTRGQ